MKTGIVAVAVIAVVIIAAAAYVMTQPAAPVVTTTTSKTTTTTPTTTTTTTTPVQPLKVAIIFTSPLEEPWNKGMYTDVKSLENELKLEVSYIEKVAMADVERVLREYADMGNNIIFAHSTGFASSVKKVAASYPNTYFMVPEEVLVDAPNTASYYYWFYDAMYTMGVISGMMTKTNKIGGVFSFPNIPNLRCGNAIVAGAKSVNPNVEWKPAYIEAYTDVPKAKEATMSLIAWGADAVYANRMGTIEACEEYLITSGKKVYNYGYIVDETARGPNTNITNPFWDHRPVIRMAATTIRNKTFQGGKYYVYSMKEGGSFLSPWPSKLADVSQAVLSKANETLDKFKAGTLVAPIDPALPENWRGKVVPEYIWPVK